MALAARLPQPSLPEPATTEQPWSGEVHGEVAALHRAIEERLVAGPERLAVVPLPVRSGDALATAVSRLAGWAALGGGFGAALLLLR